jgi:hypothetical protein
MGEFRHVQGGSIPIRAETSIVEVPLAAKIARNGSTEWMDTAARSEETFAESSTSARLLAPDRRSVILGLSAQRSIGKALTRANPLRTEWREIEKRFAAKSSSNERLMRLRVKSGKNALDGYALFEAIRNRNAVLTNSALWSLLLEWFKSEGGGLQKIFRPISERLQDGPFCVTNGRNRFSPQIETTPFSNWQNWRLWPLPDLDIPVETESTPAETDLLALQARTICDFGQIFTGRPPTPL